MKFTEILSQLNIEYKTEGHHHCRPNWIQLDCPFCAKDSKKWHLGYSLEYHFLNCWRCGVHQPVETLIEITNLSFSECKKLLAGIETTKVKREKPKGKLKLPIGVEELQNPHVRYLQARGFKVSKLKSLWQIKGIAVSTKFAWRIFIPIIHHGKTVSWTTRSISHNNKITRYISASLKEESIPHKSLLYGEDYVQDSVIIHEGPFDVWRTGPGAVATLGTGYSNEQLSRMVKYQKRIICFDNEREAQKRANKLCDNLSVFPGETFNIQLDAKDAAEASKKEIKLLRRFLKNG